jgi:hypothetical protein
VLETPITCHAAGTTVSILVPRKVDRGTNRSKAATK